MKKLSLILSLVMVLSIIFSYSIQPVFAANYGDALLKSVQWFDANKCGPDVVTSGNVFTWRGACHTADSDGSVSLTGGFHDAGDHVKFGLPQAFAAANLGWALYEYKAQFDAAGATAKALSELKYFTDYFLKSHPNATTFYYMVGDGGADHGYWGPPENQTGSRPVTKCTSTTKAADMCGQTAAALALMSINYKATNATYAAQCLQAAKELFAMGQTTDTTTAVRGASGGFYNSSSHFDDLALGAIWLYKATGDSSYLTNVDTWIAQKNDPGDDPFMKPWTHCWDDSTLANLLLMAKISQNKKYYQALVWNMTWYRDTLTKTPAGLPYLNNWAVLRYDSAEAGMMYLMYKYFGNSDYIAIANKMVDYVTGTNPKSLSYLTNYGTNSVKHPHHRANEPNKDGVTKGMVGALAGGPDSGDGFVDDVNQYVYTEVALDYNASFILGASGRLYKDGGGAAGSPIPTPSPAPTVAPGSGTGLTGTYYTGTALAGTPVLTRTDATINFTWSGSPDTTTTLPADGYSARWSGQVQARSTEPYTFYFNHDDGGRVWVNGTQIINNWTDHAATEDFGTVSLSIGQKYDIVVEFYESAGDAVAQLSWATGTIAKQIIPSSQLYTVGGPTTPPTVTPTATPSTATQTPTATPSTATQTPTATPSTGTPTATPTATPSTSTPTATPSTSTPTATPSTSTPTATPSTSTPTPTPSATSGGIKVQFFNGNTAATTNSIYPNFKVVNTGTAAVTLADVKVRYYFTNDGTQANSYACDYASIGSGNVTGTFATIAKTNADRYLEVGFTSGAGTLAAGAGAEVKGRLWKSDWSNFTQTNDYSFNASATNYVDATTVTGYIAGALKWGTEP